MEGGDCEFICVFRRSCDDCRVERTVRCDCANTFLSSFRWTQPQPEPTATKMMIKCEIYKRSPHDRWLMHLNVDCWSANAAHTEMGCTSIILAGHHPAENKMDFATENKSTNSTLKNSFDFGLALCGGTMCNRIDEIDQSSQFAKRAHAIQWFWSNACDIFARCDCCAHLDNDNT